MRVLTAALVALTFSSSLVAQHHAKLLAPQPEQFEIGVHAYFDFGPPFDFFQLYLVRPSETGTRIERLIFSPSGAKCLAPAKLETSRASLPESVAELLGSKNVCAIPDKELRREQKRCKKCGHYSGQNVTLRVRCGAATRLIRSDIFERDMFDPAIKTPEHTSRTMQLLNRLDQVLGPGVMEKPAFPIPDEPQASSAAPAVEDNVLQGVGQGNYDALFPASDTKLATLYQETQQPPPPPPTVRLKTPLSVTPEVFAEPIYPPLARMTRVEGDVTMEFEIDLNGSPKAQSVLAGHPLLRPAALDAVGKWKFAVSAAGQKIQATLAFALNCHR